MTDIPLPEIEGMIGPEATEIVRDAIRTDMPWDGLNRMMRSYAAQQLAAMRWSQIQWSLITTGRMPAEPISYRWYTDIWPWSITRPLHLRFVAWRREAAARLRYAIRILRTGIPDD